MTLHLNNFKNFYSKTNRKTYNSGGMYSYEQTITKQSDLDYSQTISLLRTADIWIHGVFKK